MKLAIVGSRGFDSYAYLSKTLEIYFSQIDEIVSGGARGADSLGGRYAREHEIPLKEFIPDWNLYGKSAGFKRNEQIVDEATALAAYWDGQSHGTKHSINLARNLQKPVIIFLYPKKQIITFSWESMLEGILGRTISAIMSKPLDQEAQDCVQKNFWAMIDEEKP